MLEILGDRKAVIAREVTKIYEEFARGFLSEIISDIANRDIKGEVVILVSRAASEGYSGHESLQDILKQYLSRENLSFKDAVKIVARETGLKKSIVYEEALKLSKD